MSKILVIFTGGTIASTLRDGVMDTDKEKNYKLIDSYLNLDDSVTFETKEPYFILSENLSFDNINTLCKCVKESLSEDYDGIVVTHGTDTLQYSASALDIILGNINIPVILVSSNYPLEDTRANGFDNFIGAIKTLMKQ